MQTLFTTAEAPVRERFDFWRAVLRENIVDHDSTTEDPLKYNAALHAGSIADIRLLVCEMAAMDVHRTARHVANADPDELLLSCQASGRMKSFHKGAVLSLEPGDVGLVDPRQRHFNSFSEGSRHIIAKISRQELNARLGVPLHLPMFKIARAGGLSTILSDMMQSLPQHEPSLDDAGAQLVQTQLLDVTALAIAKTLGRDADRRLSWSRSLSLIRIRSAIAQRLADPRLDAATVAAAAGFSVRYANELLASEGSSLGAAIRNARLDRCRAAIEDRGQDHRTISEIAFGWGFSDLTHFGRVFRAAYGAPPRDYRRASRKR